MGNLIDLWAETGASYIGDDAQPALTITNSSTGAGVQTNRLVATSSATIATLTATTLTTTNTILSAVTVAQLNVAQAIAVANATIIGTSFLGASVASGAVLSFRGDALVSASTIKFITGAVAGTYALRVVIPNGQLGWIPVLPDTAVTLAAI